MPGVRQISRPAAMATHIFLSLVSMPSSRQGIGVPPCCSEKSAQRQRGFPGRDAPLASLMLVIGAGAIGASHVTDSGFWFVKESLGIPMGSMYATYTAGTTIAAVLGLIGTLLLSMFL